MTEDALKVQGLHSCPSTRCSSRSESIVDMSDGEDTFIWQDYLDVTHTTEVPHILFNHVEESLLSSLKVGMILEVPLKAPDQFWVASIVMPCGPLLRLRYVGAEEDRKQEFWCDITKVTVHPIGWCEENRMQLTVPEELKDKLTDAEGFVRNVIRNATCAPAEFLSGDGLIPIDRIKTGMKLEVQNEFHPHHLWIATVIENVGGRLRLKYDTPDSSAADFWLFYQSPRLFPMGWVEEKGSPWELKWPTSKVSSHSIEEWTLVIEMAKEDARHLPLPPNLFQHNVEHTPHDFKVGMKLEAINPSNMNELCPATVTKVFDPYYFLVQIDMYNVVGDSFETRPSWLCTVHHHYIFPVGWGHEHDVHLVPPRGCTPDFTWTKYLTCTASQVAPKSCFFKSTAARKAGFKPGMKLEAVNPECPSEICASSIIKTMEHLIWICLESNESDHRGYIFSIESQDIFPVGWSESNSYPLQPPRFYQIPAKPVKAVEVESECLANRRSSWCPKIYFNHRCFSGPFLCKGKLALLPKVVGPGPVTLVMREVLSMLISIAYKSSRVLKELQENDNSDRGLHLEAFKAKYKTNAYRANIAIVTSADKVPAFCQDVCKRLQVCPNLFGPTLFSEACPENCSSLSKTRYTHYWSNAKRGRPKGDISNLVSQRKRKRRRKLMAQNQSSGLDSLPVITPEDFSCILALAGITKGYVDPTTSESTSSQLPVASTGCIASAAKIKRRYKKKVIPLTQMKTRGAKLPKYSKHWSRKGGWKRLDLRKHNTASFSPSDQRPPNSLMTPMGNSTHGFQISKLRQTRIAKPRVPVRKYTPPNVMKLESDPRTWSERDVFQFLQKTDDCAHIAQLCKDQLIDGFAFMLLNLPTMCEQLHLDMDEALKLCHHVEEIKLAFYVQYNYEM